MEKVAKVRTVTRNGKTFQQTYWVNKKPKISKPQITNETTKTVLKEQLTQKYNFHRLSKKALEKVKTEIEQRVEDIDSQGFFDSCGNHYNFPPVWEKEGKPFMEAVANAVERTGLWTSQVENKGVISSDVVAIAGFNGVQVNPEDSDLIDIALVLRGEENGVKYNDYDFSDFVGHNEGITPDEESRYELCGNLAGVLEGAGFDVEGVGISGWSSSDTDSIYCVATVSRWD